jgi:hypothetical protein
MRRHVKASRHNLAKTDTKSANSDSVDSDAIASIIHHEQDDSTPTPTAAFLSTLSSILPSWTSYRPDLEPDSDSHSPSWAKVFAVDTRSIALFRVWIGIFMFVDLMFKFSMIEILYSDEGVYRRIDAVGGSHNPWWRSELTGVR